MDIIERISIYQVLIMAKLSSSPLPSIWHLIAINAVVCGLEIAACVAFTFIPPLLLKVSRDHLPLSSFIIEYFLFRLVSQRLTCPSYSVWLLSWLSSRFPALASCLTVVTADTAGGDPSSSPSPSSLFSPSSCFTSARVWTRM